MKYSFILSTAAILIGVGCSTQKSLINSPEVAVYDKYVLDKMPQDILGQLEARANEPQILAGEDVECLTLTSLSLFKHLGDSESSSILSQAGQRQLSALRLFVHPEYLGNSYPKTKGIIECAKAGDDWAAVQAEKDYQR